MKILAIETSTEACSAALSVEGEIKEKFSLEPRQHTKLILNMVDDLLASAQLLPQQLNAVALSRGPGSFTGVRIATSVAHGIAFGADIPIVPISTLAAIAQGFFNQHNEVSCSYTAMDARMSEIFWAVYKKNEVGLAQLLGEEYVTPAYQIIFSAQRGYGVGSGWKVFQAELSAILGDCLIGVAPDFLPRAAAIAQLAEFDFKQGLAVAPELAMPVYLRDKVAKTLVERQLTDPSNL